MDQSTKWKYGAGGLLVMSMFALVVMGKVDAGSYFQLATVLLAGLGGHAAASSIRGPANSGAAPAPSADPSPAASLTLEAKS